LAEFPLALLTDLASKETHVGWIGDSTELEHLLGDLLHDARRFCEISRTTDAPSNAKQREAIGEFCAAIELLKQILADYDHSNIADLFESDPHWQLIRERAANVLKAFEPLR
jgi:hypothetical protein